MVPTIATGASTAAAQISSDLILRRESSGLRHNCVNSLHREVGVRCGKHDVIMHSEHWLHVRDARADDTVEVTSDTADVTADLPANVTGDMRMSPQLSTSWH